jgi:ABC-2 type transport system permease protein
MEKRSNGSLMKKYFQLFTLSWQNGFVYRTSLFLWRLRQFLSTIMSLTIWTVLFQSQNALFGYSQSQMITYIFLVGILQSFILATILNGLADTIYSGNLSFQLVKPINLFAYFFTQDMADKLKNVLFIAIETTILFFIFKPQVLFPPFPVFLLFIIWTTGGILLNFFIQLIFASLGFWSPETWGPRFLFFMLVDFTAGKLFPLDILPSVLKNAIAFTPFPFLSFWQIQLFLQKLTPTQVIQQSIVLGVWVGLMAVITVVLWKRGIKEYSAAGQ